MVYPGFKFIFKGSILLIHIQVITFIRIVGNINIRVTIAIDITYRNTQTKADQAAVYTRFFGNLSKMPIIVAVQMIATAF